MLWQQTWRADPIAARLSDRHYSRQHVGTAQFTPPGRVLVLRTAAGDAVWATSWPQAAFVHRLLPGAWCNVLFRNESPARASELIAEAVAVTRWRWPGVPPEGMITLIDPRHVQPIRRRGVPVYGWTYRQVGFEEVGQTQGGLIALQLLPAAMPDAAPPRGGQLRFWEDAA